MATVIALLAVFGVPLYFTTAALLGYTYSGAESSNSYVLFVSLVFFAALGAFSVSFIKRPSLATPDIAAIAFVTAALLNHLVWLAISPYGVSPLPRHLILFLALGVPGILAARAVGEQSSWYRFLRLCEVAALLMSISLTVTSFIPLIQRTLVLGIGGATYQSASYIAAFTTGLLAFFGIKASPKMRYRVFRGKLVSVAYGLLAIPLVAVAIANGGRGAFLLLVIYAMLTVRWLLGKARRGAMSGLGVLVMVCVLAMVSAAAFENLSQSESIQRGFGRVISFLGSESGLVVDLELGSSGRDVVYATVIRAIADQPLVGYGVFTAWDRVIQPHNFLLDIALQWGIPTALFVLFLFGWLLRKIGQLPSEHAAAILTLGAFPFASLMFSGGYLFSAQFWLVLLVPARLAHHMRPTSLEGTNARLPSGDSSPDTLT